MNYEGLKSQLRQALIVAKAHKRPVALIRLTLLHGAQCNGSADEVTALMEKLREVFHISEGAVYDAIKASPLLSEIWPRGEHVWR
jgi:hypothetical protein